jgi:hypothetical protein
VSHRRVYEILLLALPVSVVIFFTYEKAYTHVLCASSGIQADFSPNRSVKTEREVAAKRTLLLVICLIVFSAYVRHELLTGF